MAKLNTAIQVIRESIEENDGQFGIKMEVSRVTSCDVLPSDVIIIQAACSQDGSESCDV